MVDAVNAVKCFFYNYSTNCFKYRLVEQEVHPENKQQQTINMFTNISD